MGIKVQVFEDPQDCMRAINQTKRVIMQQEKIWDYFQTDPTAKDVLFGSLSRYKFIGKRIPEKSRILNIGIGRGGLEIYLINRPTNVEIHSLDPSEKTIAYMKQNFENHIFAKVGYSQNLPYEDEYFDIVIMTEVLEHLTDDKINKTLKECYRVLRTNGRFIGTVPADEQLHENMVICPDCGKTFHRWGHVQSFSAEILTTKLQSNFASAHVKRHFFGDWTTLNWKGRVDLIVKKISRMFGLKGSRENFYFEAQK